MAATRPRRLDQLLSACGYCSRRDARVWLRRGRVTVNGQPALSADQRVDPALVLIDGEPPDHPDGLLVLLHKKAGLVCSHDEGEGPSIYDGLPERWLDRNPPVTSVGRLDKDATGLLILTDQGDWVHQWTSPRNHVPRTYEVTVDRPLDAALVSHFASGSLPLPGDPRPCAPARLEIVGERQARLELTEGRFHQVKRMFGGQGWLVTGLHRVKFGQFELGNLAAGEWRIVEEPSNFAAADSAAAPSGRG